MLIATEPATPRSLEPAPDLVSTSKVWTVSPLTLVIVASMSTPLAVIVETPGVASLVIEV